MVPVNVSLPSVLVLLLLPLALAHQPAGTPKNYCEPLNEWNTHDYAAGFASASVRAPNVDGNVMGDCDGSGFGVNPNGPSLTYGMADFDGHHEWSVGWGRILVESGSGLPSGSPNVPSGTLFCYGLPGHHSNFGPVTVDDVVLGAGATFYVMADTVDVVGTGNGCGDGQITLEAEPVTMCINTCTVTFPAGLDGSYMVVVTGTAGHIIW